jgi:hypothetical protein
VNVRVGRVECAELHHFDLADAPIAGPPLLEGEFPGGDTMMVDIDPK